MCDRRRREAFPDGEVKVVKVIVQGNWAVVAFINRGTHAGPLQSSLGTVPPTGRKMEVRYCSVIRVDDGKVVEGRDYCDSASIAPQLGLTDSWICVGGQGVARWRCCTDSLPRDAG